MFVVFLLWRYRDQVLFRKDCFGLDFVLKVFGLDLVVEDFEKGWFIYVYGCLQVRCCVLLRKMFWVYIVKVEWMFYSFYIKVLFFVQKGLQLGSK